MEEKDLLVYHLERCKFLARKQVSSYTLEMVFLCQKHGHLFQHPWVSRSPRWVRGKIARMLSGKVSIAARLDAYNGQPWGESEVADIEQKVAEIRKRHPKPTRR
ncbi:MAG TPA: hypothetical protein EYO22_04585 [Candidatus Poseidoniales archaeon]|nr:hypothetical protein [Candidatus Poseidoniales archaeon]